MALETKVNKDGKKTDLKNVQNTTADLEKLLNLEYMPNQSISVENQKINSLIDVEQQQKDDDLKIYQLIALFGCIGFGAISYDVFGDSAHLFAPMDQFVHNWVNQNCTEQMKSFSDQIISNIPIAIGTIGCTCSAAKIMLKGNKSELLQLVLSLPFFVLGFGYYDGHFKAGGVAANTFKQIFHRTRPSEYLHSYAYPSGHSSTETFMMGGWAVTGSGRLLADVHWFSDVCAGFCLGLVLVSTGKLTLSYFQQIQEKNQKILETSNLDTIKF